MPVQERIRHLSPAQPEKDILRPGRDRSLGASFFSHTQGKKRAEVLRGFCARTIRRPRLCSIEEQTQVFCSRTTTCWLTWALPPSIGFPVFREPRHVSRPSKNQDNNRSLMHGTSRSAPPLPRSPARAGKRLSTRARDRGALSCCIPPRRGGGRGHVHALLEAPRFTPVARERRVLQTAPKWNRRSRLREPHEHHLRTGPVRPVSRHVPARGGHAGRSDTRFSREGCCPALPGAAGLAFVLVRVRSGSGGAGHDLGAAGGPSAAAGGNAGELEYVSLPETFGLETGGALPSDFACYMLLDSVEEKAECSHLWEINTATRHSLFDRDQLAYRPPPLKWFTLQSKRCRITNLQRLVPNPLSPHCGCC